MNYIINVISFIYIYITQYMKHRPISCIRAYKCLTACVTRNVIGTFSFFHWTALKTFYFFHWLGEMADNSHWHCEDHGIRASNANYL